MRLDHIAYRVADKNKSAQFFIDALGYKIQTEFEIDFGEGQKAKCLALEPSEKTKDAPWHILSVPTEHHFFCTEYHLAPEIFVSDGTPGSVVWEWVASRSGIGGIHHLAYQVDSVLATMQEWKEKGYAEFTTENPLTCPGLTQIFTKPSSLTGVIYEFIERGAHGFCSENVKALMESTKGQ